MQGAEDRYGALRKCVAGASDYEVLKLVRPRQHLTQQFSPGCGVKSPGETILKN